MIKIIKDYISPNYSDRAEQNSLKYIVIHYTEMAFKDALEKLCAPDSGVSAHYLIHEDGRIFNLVADSKKAWHAGKSSWRQEEGVNEFSIGIELDNLGNKPFAAAQLDSLVNLCNYLTETHKLDRTQIFAHSDIAPSRKIDPGYYFDWSFLAENNLGIMPEKSSEVQGEILIKYGEKGEKVRLLQRGLSFVGYEIDENTIYDKKTSDVVRAFMLHYSKDSLYFQGEAVYHKNLDNIFHWDNFAEQSLEALLARLPLNLIKKQN